MALTKEEWNAKFLELMKENPRFLELCESIDDLHLLVNEEHRMYMKFTAWYACKWQGALHLVK